MVHWFYRRLSQPQVNVGLSCELEPRLDLLKFLGETFRVGWDPQKVCREEFVSFPLRKGRLWDAVTVPCVVFIALRPKWEVLIRVPLVNSLCLGHFYSELNLSAYSEPIIVSCSSYLGNRVSHREADHHREADQTRFWHISIISDWNRLKFWECKIHIWYFLAQSR